MLQIGQCVVPEDFSTCHPGAALAQMLNIFVPGPTKHRTQNASSVRRLLRTRTSVIYTRNQESHINIVKREEIPRTDFRSSFVCVMDIPGSQNTMQRSADTNRTDEDRNAACKDGQLGASDWGWMKVRTEHSRGVKKRTMSKSRDPRIG